MDPETKETLKKIQKHLKALVNLKVIKMAEQRAQSGDFVDETESGKPIINLDKAGEYQFSLIERAYRDLAVKKEKG